MILQPSANVPGTLRGQVEIVGGRLLLVLAEPCDRVELYVEGPDLWRVQLNAEQLAGLRQLLADAAGRMAAG